MKIRNEHLFNGILPDETEEKIISILDKADKWESLSQSARKDFWRMSQAGDQEEGQKVGQACKRDYPGPD